MEKKLFQPVDISEIEKISEKKSFWVSQKFSVSVIFWVFVFWTISVFWVENFWIWASLTNVESLHWSAEIVQNFDLFKNFYIFLFILFFAIYTLYIFAKIELQKFWSKNWWQTDFALHNFPSIYILETMTMLYVIMFVILSFNLILKIDFENAFKTMNSAISTVALFALFWGALSSLFYFLHKVRPWKFQDWEQEKYKKIDFDINRVLKYLAFPFISAWMWVISYLISMWIWEIFWIEALKAPNENFLILFAVMTWYFCDAFVIFFHSIFKSIEKVLNKKISK